MHFDPALAASLIPVLLHGAFNTLLVTLASISIAATTGLALEILRRQSVYLRLPISLFIDFLRSTPFLAQLYFLYFVLPFYGIDLPALVIGIGGLGLYFSSYLAEVFRAGIDSVAKGQLEAAKALGLDRWQLIALVLLPQMLRNVAPMLGSYFISLLKATPYLAVIAVPEMLGQALDVASETFRYDEPLMAVGFLFLLLSLGLGQVVRWLEARLATPTRNNTSDRRASLLLAARSAQSPYRS
jgi:polar amino acid transport system permease protein